MAANLFGRYVWLMDILLRYKRLTFQENIFYVYIECDRKDGYRYYIDEPEPVNDEMRNFAQNIMDYYTEKKEGKPCEE